MDIFSGAGSLASLYAVYENWRNQPQVKKLQEDINFTKWLCNNGFVDIAKDLELIIAKNQRLEDIAISSVELLHKELRIINQSLNTSKHPVAKDVELELRVQSRKAKEKTRPFSSIEYRFELIIKNNGKRKISNAQLKIKFPEKVGYKSRVGFEGIFQEEIELIKQTSIFGKDEQVFEFDLGIYDKNFEAANNSTIIASFHWDSDVADVEIPFNRFLTANGEALRYEDFKKNGKVTYENFWKLNNVNQIPD